MLTLIIGDIIGMSHSRRGSRARGVPPAYGHFPHRAITAPVEGFHLGSWGTFHLMRPYVIEYSGQVDELRYEWRTRCGIWRFWVDADGRCTLDRSARIGEALSPFCPRCGRCQQLADQEAEAVAWRQRLPEIRRRLQEGG
jgi:hypothetical protein